MKEQRKTDIRDKRRIKEIRREQRRREERSDEKIRRVEMADDKSDGLNIDSVLKIIPFILYVVMIPLYKYQIEYVWSKIAWGYVSMALFGAVITYIYWKNKNIFFNFPRTFLLVFAFLIYGVLSALWATNPYKTQNLAVMIGPGILAYLASQTLNSKEIRIISIFIAITSAIVSGYGILQLIGVYPMPPDQYGNPNPITTFGLSNFAVEYLLLAFSLVIGFSFAERGPMKYLFITSSLINFIYIFGAKNRAGWVGMATILAGFSLIYTLQKIRYGTDVRKVLRYTGATLVILALLFAAFLNFTDYGKQISGRLKSFVQVGPGSSVTTRLMAWNASYEMMKDSPIFGVGAGNYEILSWKYAPRLLDEATMFTNTRVDKAHNEYVQIMADLGIVGFSIFLGIIFIVFSLYLDIFRDGGEKNKQYPFFVATGIILGIVSTLAGASFNFSLQWPGSVTHFWLFIGFLEVIRSDVKNEQKIELSPRNKIIYLIPGLFFIVASLGAPCKDGIPGCQSGVCLWRKICRISPGFFTARNFTLAEVYYRYGQFYKRMRNFAVSERFYIASLNYENPAERTYYDMAYLYLAMNGGVIDQNVLDLLEGTLKLVPYFGKGRRELGKMYIQIGQIDKGIEYTLRSTDSNPANIPEAYSTVANAYIMKGDYDKAIEYAQRAIYEIDNSPSKKRYGLSVPEIVFNEAEVRFLSYFVLGTAYTAKKNYDKAEEYLKLSLSIKPDNPRVIINLATLYINEGKFDEAEKILNSFEPRDDNEKAAKLFNLASLYAAKGEKERAIEFLTAASSVRPEIINKAFQDINLKKYLTEESK
ncbi:MAG: O-antigen ligase family protein [bacterium]|nr:O-antigen ligase family protein [bacterium]